jgi:hypothetical protein
VARKRETNNPTNVTPKEKMKECRIDLRYSVERKRFRKLSAPTKTWLSPKGELLKTERRSESKAGQKKKTRTTPIWGAISR